READAQGGDTTAHCCNAYGGHGDNHSSPTRRSSDLNDAQVGQDNQSSGSGDSWGGGCKPSCHPNSGSEQENESTINQGDNHATGGNANTTGGNCGNAHTGNTQHFNRNAGALSLGWGS